MLKKRKEMKSMKKRKLGMKRTWKKRKLAKKGNWKKMKRILQSKRNLKRVNQRIREASLNLNQNQRRVNKLRRIKVQCMLLIYCN
jgi:hypothetical protein